MTCFDDDTPLDQATSRRLHRLAAMPVDLSGLQARLQAEIPRSVPARTSTRWKLPLRPMHAVAASLLVGALTIGIALSLSARPVLASPQMLETLYHESAAGEMPPGSPPSTMDPAGPVMACCIQRVKGKPVTCIALDSNGTRVSMALAEAKSFRVPAEATAKTTDGLTYYVQSSATINMVMAVKGETWVCLMGPVSEADLVKLLVKTPVTK